MIRRMPAWIVTFSCLMGLVITIASYDRMSTHAAPPASVATRLDMTKDEQIAFFKKKVEPVLRDHCYECHSADSKELKGNLRLDTREGLRKGAANGPAVVPGDPDASFLIRSIRYTEDDYKMPPRGKLDDEILQDLESWIKSGAEDGRP